ncbi:MAG: hypothetical protein ACLUJG_12005 [Lawsonibacter sp.]
MLYRKSLTALLALALTVGLTACSSKPPEEPEPPESQPSVSVMAPVKPEPEPVLPYVNSHRGGLRAWTWAPGGPSLSCSIT